MSEAKLDRASFLSRDGSGLLAELCDAVIDPRARIARPSTGKGREVGRRVAYHAVARRRRVAAGTGRHDKTALMARGAPPSRKKRSKVFFPDSSASLTTAHEYALRAARSR